MAMAFVSLTTLCEVSSEEIELETLWTSYRKLLLDFRVYLRDEKREKEFKYFSYGSIPGKNWDVDMVDWLIKLEQSDLISMDDLEILCSFLITYNDSASRHILSVIRAFQCRLDIVGMISGSDDSWMYSPPLKIKKFKISKGLDVLLKKWKREMEEASNLSTPMINKIYSEATQRIAQVASENKQGEALVIAQFLMKMEGMAYNVADEQYILKA